MPLLVWLKVVHVATVMVWVGGLIILPALLHALTGADDRWAFRRVRAQLRLVYLGIISPAAIIAISSGALIVWVGEVEAKWFAWKLMAVTLLVAIHIACGVLIGRHRRPRPARLPAAIGLTFGVAISAGLVLLLVLAKPVDLAMPGADAIADAIAAGADAVQSSSTPTP